MNARGTGQTTQQLKGAPTGAIFVWLNSDLWYPRKLALELGRKDLKIVGPAFLTNKGNFMGRGYMEIIFDHAFRADTERKREDVDWLMYFLRTQQPKRKQK